MDQLPRRGNQAFPDGNMFGDSRQLNGYDNLFQTGPDQSQYDASWGVNASNYQAPSRTQQPAPSWPQHANHLSPTPAGLSGQPLPYGRSLSHSPAQPYGQHSFNDFGAQQHYPYQQPQYDPTLVPPQTFNQTLNYSNTSLPNVNAGTIAPHALQNDSRSSTYGRSPYDLSDYQLNNARAGRPYQTDVIDQHALVRSIPKSNNAGYFSITNFNNLAQATKSERMGSFLNIGIEAQNWDVNRAALPAYVPRKSRHDLRKSAGNDPKVLAKLGKKIVKHQKPSIIAPRATPLTTTAGSPTSAEKIKYEDDSSTAEESSSDDEGSSYTSDDVAESSPLPPKRPDLPKEATEYDTIKALWRSKRKRPSPESIRKGLVDFWEIAKTIRDRWKADANAVTDAETKKRVNELPLLRSRVKDQRDMMEVAFKAALKHGHKDIVELFSQNQSLMYLCYQFLLDRSKEDDHNGTLARALLETISLSTTLKEDTFEKTHLVKVVPRFAKKGDARTQFYAKRIITNASTASTDNAGPDAKKPTSNVGAAASPTGRRAELEPVAGIKRSASTVCEGGVQKKVATGASKLNGTTTASKLGAVKKASTSDTSKTSAAPMTSVKAKQVTAKPSGLFASLQSAAKKPGTSNASRASGPGGTSTTAEKTSTTQSSAPKSTFSFTETMANLSKPREEKPVVKLPVQQTPEETPEEKAKRLRKESRRHLHVSFKPLDELVEVHVFHHDPDEEIGHDASQVRDVADVGGEGRMFKKQNQMMDIDEDDEATEEEEKLAEFKEPSEVDFYDIEQEQRKSNYAPYGGGELEPESTERVKREYYEANNLMVFYSDEKDIPPNPREPSDPYNGDPVTSFKKIAAPEEKYASRGRQKSAGFAQQYGGIRQPTTAHNPAAPFDLSKFLANQQVAQPTLQPAAVPPSNAISDLLASLNRGTPAQAATPPQPLMGGFQLPQQFQPSAPPIAPQPQGQPDLAAILAQITQNQAAPAPAMGGYGYNNAAAAPNMMGYQPPAQQSGVYENPERKQWREGANNQSRDKRQNTGQNPYYKTKVCKYWQEGRCQKGDGCTYKHEES